MPALTELAIKAAKPHTTLWDSTLPGFGIRCGVKRKTFIVLIASGRRHSLGHWPLQTLQNARSEAKKLLAEKTLGREFPTVTAHSKAISDFLTVCEKRNKPRTVRDYKRLLNKHYAFGNTAIASITPRDIIKKLNALNGTPSEKHHAVLAGRIFYKWCVRQHIIDRSPMEKIVNPPKGTSRDRILSDEELAIVYKAAREGKGTMHRIIALCLLTGQRRSEIGGLQWSFINEKEKLITFPASYTKNKKEHIFPVSDAVIDILKDIPRISDTYVFPATREHDHGKPTTVWNGWGKGKKNFDEDTGVTGWVLHDCRRQVSSGMASLGVPQVVVEKLLNHVSGGSQSQIAAIYNRHQYLEEMRSAVEIWEKHLATL